ncbi:MAG: GNAT family N-acetyltransferase [Desulfobacter sp.]|nr:GNAT family N-acetyltransferase [Desulfobacter sp.]WDP87740.1 MAG: GNAT family N-acetyltransferase [Desulfobacter sp.]
MADTWQIKRFDQLSINELYALLRLRTDIFVVEQKCPYPELDGKDDHEQTIHLWQYAQDHTMSAYLRILAPGVSYAGASLGRVAVHKEFRNHGLAHSIVDKAIDVAKGIWPEKKIEISAQVYLTHFYESHGFQAVSPPYLEDNIPHIDMVLNRT